MKTLLISIMAMYLIFIIKVPPINFFKYFPKDWYKLGKYKAYSVKYRRFSEPIEYESILTFYIKGLAYIAARHKACWLDLQTKGLERTVSVGWRIKRLT